MFRHIAGQWLPSHGRYLYGHRGFDHHHVHQQLRINHQGPAAGLIVIAVGCIEDFGGNGMLEGFSDVDMQAYRAALAVGVAAAVLQILFGLLRAGILGEFFPRSAIHGMLAAIGVIIIAKQVPVAMGVSAKGEPLHLLLSIPHYIMEANPAIALIGIVSLIILFSWPAVRKRIKPMAAVPPQLIVLVVAVVLGWCSICFMITTICFKVINIP